MNTVRFNADAKGVTSLWSATWTKGWTAFAPFTRGPQARYVAYKSGTGRMAVDRILPDGKGIATIREMTWPTGLHNVVVRRPGLWDVMTCKRVSSGVVDMHQITQ